MRLFSLFSSYSLHTSYKLGSWCVLLVTGRDFLLWFVENKSEAPRFLTYSTDREKEGTVEPRFNEPLFYEVFDVTNDILRPGQIYSKMYWIEHRYNEARLNEFFDITNIIRKPKCKMYLDITNYNVSTLNIQHTIQQTNPEQINSQQIL